MAGDARELLALASRIGDEASPIDLADVAPCFNPDGVALRLVAPGRADGGNFVWPCLGVAAVKASIEALAEGRSVEATFELLPGPATLLVERSGDPA